MTKFTVERIKKEIASLQTVYDYFKSKMTYDSSAFELATVIYTTICTLESCLKYEAKDLELPFSIESIKQSEYV